MRKITYEYVCDLIHNEGRFYATTNPINTIEWLNENTQSDGIIYELDGYMPTKISTFAI